MALIESEDPVGIANRGKHYRRRICEADAQILILLNNGSSGGDVGIAEVRQFIGAPADLFEQRQLGSPFRPTSTRSGVG